MGRCTAPAIQAAVARRSTRRAPTARPLPPRFTPLPSNGNLARFAGISTAARYFSRKPSDLPAGARWVFDHDFFLLLNVAVGGVWPGNPDATTTFPQEMKVDYVRVYRR